MNEDVRAQKDALEKLNTQKSTSRRILTGILLKNSELKPNLRLILSGETCPKFTITNVILLKEKFLKFDWLRAVVFQLNLKYLRVKITNLLRVVV